MTYSWWIYPEAVTYNDQVDIKNPTSSKNTIQVPKHAAERSIHIVLALRDYGHPQLSNYPRIVLNVTDN